MFKVYLLQSTSRSHLTYVGHTGLGVDQRLHLHNTNTGCKYTRGKGPWVVVCYISGFGSRKLAMKPTLLGGIYACGDQMPYW